MKKNTYLLLYQLFDIKVSRIITYFNSRKYLFCPSYKKPVPRIIVVLMVIYYFSLPDIFSQSGQPEMTDLLQKLVQIPSIHGNEKPAGELLIGFAEANGLCVEILTDEDKAFNLVISLYPLHLGKPNILLLSHLDVVDPGPESEWIYPPYSGSITGDTIWGRGAFDNKSNTVMHLFALLDFSKNRNQEDYSHNISLVILSDEENGGVNGAQLVASLFLERLNPVLAIGEGPHGINQVLPRFPNIYVHPISVSNKNKLLLEVEIKNPKEQSHACFSSRHSSNNKLIDALFKIKNKKEEIVFNETTINMLKTYGSYEKGIKRFLLNHPVLFKGLLKNSIRNSNELLPFFSNTHNITRIENPEQTSNNVIPGYSRAIIDCRLQPHISVDKYIQRLCRNINPHMVSISPLYRSKEHNTSPVNNHFYSVISNTLREIFPDGLVMPGQLPFSTDCQYFRAKGVPVYSFTPIQLPKSIPQSAHGINEHFSLSALVPGKNNYIKILKSLMIPQQTILTSNFKY